ncbi:Visual pigment-like receptor peropsin [Channa argus]|uniref:Visual pigment-like receptor peropsin n=1 Tax=Channa argus TaxID=215402 RepID=A0A6G1PAC3_CHAAH|nr:Visual pigment-like receptor peropsin [Channa argus]
MVTKWINGTILMEGLWLGAEKWLVVAVLGLEMLMGIVGNSLVLLVKVKRLIGRASTGRIPFVVMVTACSASWVTGMVFGIIPVVYTWVRYDPAEMLCAVFWESSYSDMLVYILCAFFICIFIPFTLIFICSLLRFIGCRLTSETPEISDDEADLSAVTPLLVATYMFCYSPFAVAELILLGKLDLSPAPSWLRTLSSVMSYLDCTVNPLIYFSHQDFREAGLALLWTTGNNCQSLFFLLSLIMSCKYPRSSCAIF